MNAKDMKITNTVTGNQASRDEYFKVTLNITGGLPSTTYKVDLSNADATTKVGKQEQEQCFSKNVEENESSWL